MQKYILFLTRANLFSASREKCVSLQRKMKRFVVLIILLIGTVCASAQQFIGCRTERGWAETPMLRTTFHVDAGDLTETAFRSCYYGLVVTSLGYHEVYVNGTKVGDYVMQPAVSQLDKRALWVEYDITPYLREGDNELLLWIGQGWGRIYGTPAVAKAVVEETVSDGECGLIYEILKTDSTWMARPSPYSYTGSWQPMQFGGERYDARISGRNATRAKVYDAQDIVVSWQEFEGNRITDTIKPQSIEQLADGSVLLDFGRVVTGWFDIVFEKVPFGQEVTMEYLDHRDAKPPFTEHYEPYMDAFQFIKDVAVDWDTSIYIAAEPGDYIVTARKPKVSSLNKAAESLASLPDGKKGVISNATRYVYGIEDTNALTHSHINALKPRDTWYIGGITDEESREVEVKLDFLKPGMKYEATIYADAKDACGLPNTSTLTHSNNNTLKYNPYGYTITKKTVTSKTTLKLNMAPCGGFAVSIRER